MSEVVESGMSRDDSSNEQEDKETERVKGRDGKQQKQERSHQREPCRTMAEATWRGRRESRDDKRKNEGVPSPSSEEISSKKKSKQSRSLEAEDAAEGEVVRKPKRARREWDEVCVALPESGAEENGAEEGDDGTGSQGKKERTSKRKGHEKGDVDEKGEECKSIKKEPKGWEEASKVEHGGSEPKRLQKGKGRSDVDDVALTPPQLVVRKAAASIAWKNPAALRPRISSKSVRELLHHVLSQGKEPDWIKVQNVTGLVLLFVEGFGERDFKKARKEMPFLSSEFESSVLIRSPGTRHEIFPMSIEILSNSDRPQGAKAGACKDVNKTASSVSPTKPGPGAAARPALAGAGADQLTYVMDPQELVLTSAQLESNRFPGYFEDSNDEPSHAARHPKATLNGVRDPPSNSHAAPLPGWASTRPCAERHGAPRRMVAMDCEMCTTCLGLELARISVTAEDGSMLLDDLVMPLNPILDYNTMYSGITKELLSGVTTTVGRPRAPVSPLWTPHS